MSVSELSDSAQNYLKVIWALQEWSDAPVTPSAIAERIGLSLSTVSGGLGKLSDQGLVDHQRYGAVELTEQGRRHAVAMVRRHRLIETFLVQVLDYRWDQVHDEAERLEHAVSDLLIDRLDTHLGHPRRDPHGDPIPGRDGRVSVPDAVVLTTLAGHDGTEVTVERVSDDDPDLLVHLAEQGILVGTRLEVRPAPPYSDAVEVRVVGETGTVALGRVATDAVWVSVTD